MIARRIVLTPGFEAEARAGFDWINERNPSAARRFQAMIEEAVLGLGVSAERFQIVGALADSGRVVRRALVGRRVKWRLYFEINGDDVIILHLHHGARDDWTG